MNLVNFPECKHLNKIIFISTIYFSIFGIPSSRLFAQASLPEQNKYVLKSYMVIPWGEGNGQLALKIEQEKIHPPSSDTPKWALKKNSAFYNETVTRHICPTTFQIDDQGNVYIYDFVGKQPVLKKFDTKGNEVASFTDKPMGEFSIQGDKIVITNKYTHEVKYLNRNDFSSLKKFSIPKDFDMTYTTTLNGAFYKPSVGKEPQKLFVFDNEERKKYPVTENDYLYNLTDYEHIGLEKGKTEILNLSSKVKEWTKEEIFHWTFEYQDRFGDIYLAAKTMKEHWDEEKDIYETTVFKTNESGSLLFSTKINWTGLFMPGAEKLTVDRDGNIYYCWSNKDCFHIEKYQYLNDKEK